MRRSALPATVLTLMLACAADDAGAARRKECRVWCGAAIDVCVDDGDTRKRCKRRMLKACRRDGVGACIPPMTTTTTTTASVTTTVAGATTTTGGGTTTAPGASTTTTTVAGGSTTTLRSVHGCILASAADGRAAGADRTIAFANFAYTPRCLRIVAGQTVTFTGSFGSHPLVGGEIAGSDPVPDPQSPIAFTETGDTHPVAFPSAGAFLFYCDEHATTADMRGAVFVEAP